MNEEQYAKIMSDLGSNETEHKSFRRRLAEHDEALKKQNEILVIMERQSNAIEKMGGAVERVETKVNQIDDRVENLEKEPGENWKKIVFEVIKYLVIAAVGYFAAGAIKG